MKRLRSRRDFLATARGVHIRRPAFVLQAVARSGADEPRFGFTATRKLGSAPLRNRIRRRLKALVSTLERQSIAGADHVLIARPAALARPFALMADDLASAIGEARRSPRFAATALPPPSGTA